MPWLQVDEAPVAEKLVAPPRRLKPAEGRILSVDEVASRVGETPAMVKRYCKMRVFPNSFKGGTGGRTSPWRVPELDVTNFLRAHGGL